MNDFGVMPMNEFVGAAAVAGLVVGIVLFTGLAISLRLATRLRTRVADLEHEVRLLRARVDDLGRPPKQPRQEQPAAT